MLQIELPGDEFWDEAKEEFICTKGVSLKLEHSLLSLSKWESKWRKPFLSDEPKSAEEIMDYIRCMTLNPNLDDAVYARLSQQNFEEIRKYIEEPKTATWFSDDGKKHSRSREQVTSELIYYWMIALNVPFDPCEKWHLDRLMTLIKVCNVKNAPPKKMKQRDILARNAALNAARRKQLNTKG